MTPYDYLKYLIDGDHHWMNRWCCTGSDIYICVSMIISCSWMFYEYVKYGYQNGKMIEYVDNTIIKEHLRTLKTVFIQCGIIHVLSSIISWFWTPYYPICVLMVYNAYCSRKLNSQRTQILLLEAIKTTKISKQEYEEFPTLKQQLQCHIDKLEGSCKWTQS